jgi:hypothetical protein
MNQNLVDAGHTVWRVQEESDFEGMLEGADVDLVITGLENAQSIKPEVSREHPGIKILPYLALPTHAERSAAKREFGEALAMPNTPKVLLTVVAKATLNKR